MSDGGIHLTAAQAEALVAVTAPDKTVAVRQLGGAGDCGDDVYVTVVGSEAGLRIATDGQTHPIDETLPA